MLEVVESDRMGQRQELIMSSTPTLEPSMASAPPRKRPSSEKSRPIITSEVSLPSNGGTTKRKEDIGAQEKPK